jgi:hypothetical protein
MKRDMELIRLLLVEQETDEAPPELSKYDVKDVVYNAALLIDAGLVVGRIIPNSTGEPEAAVILRLTWSGHDFLDATKDPGVWAKAKEKVIKPGVSWTFSILVDFLKAEAQRQLGLSLGLPPVT